MRAASFDHAFFAPAAVHVTGQCRAAVVGCSISNAAGWGVDVSGEGTCPLFDGNTIHSSALGGTPFSFSLFAFNQHYSLNEHQAFN